MFFSMMSWFTRLLPTPHDREIARRRSARLDRLVGVEGHDQHAREEDRAADQATRNVVTVASAAEELSAPGQEVTRIVDENKSISEAAVLEARKANEGVQNLEDATERIGETIENMASSTTEISEAASQQEQAT